MERKKLKTSLRITAAVLIGASALAVGANGIYATLNATAENVVPQEAASGTLSLRLGTGADSVGFAANIENLAPGDVANRYVDLTNDGSLASTGLSLGVTATGTASLISDGATSKAVRVSITSCSVAWNVTDGTCAGTTKTEVAAAPLSALAAANSFVGTTGLAVGGVAHLQVGVTLPEQSETTVNGQLPAGTVQGGEVALTYTFSETQATAGTTHR
ncbi:TasA family protein [Tessaracoccus sp. MC1756]|uniref:TasA family protein n=1 Tax=Tessaracoccus sp. MC1756 TaxID=2760311 RepID=UPI0016000B38|nr:TasA family protein [Tessaracoccus sp. MC1756]MBB1509675.1 hypothetical protein [Tessaracoccus sp. MC1756]